MKCGLVDDLQGATTASVGGKLMLVVRFSFAVRSSFVVVWWSRR